MKGHLTIPCNPNRLIPGGSSTYVISRQCQLTAGNILLYMSEFKTIVNCVQDESSSSSLGAGSVGNSCHYRFVYCCITHMHLSF